MSTGSWRMARSRPSTTRVALRRLRGYSKRRCNEGPHPRRRASLENGPKYVASVALCGARVAKQPFRAATHLFPPCYLRAGFLSMYPARVFVFRGARLASKGLRVAGEGFSMVLWERDVDRAQTGQRP